MIRCPGQSSDWCWNRHHLVLADGRTRIRWAAQRQGRSVRVLQAWVSCRTCGWGWWSVAPLAVKMAAWLRQPAQGATRRQGRGIGQGAA